MRVPVLDVHPPAAVAAMLLSYVLPPHINTLQFPHPATPHCGDPATTEEYTEHCIFSAEQKTKHHLFRVTSSKSHVKQCRGEPDQASAGDHTCCLFIQLEQLLLWLHEHELNLANSAVY